jgi:hypothetical protein
MRNEFLIETALARDDSVRTLYRYMPYPELSDTTEFAPHHIVGITCGARMGSAALEQILRTCGMRAPRLPVFHARISKHQFVLTFETIQS